MEVIFILLPLAILLATLALAAFFWAVHRGQFDDLDTPRYRALFDDDPVTSRRISPSATPSSSPSTKTPSDPTPSRDAAHP